MPRNLLVVMVVLVIAGGAFIFRDRLAGGAGDLRVGDCFDLPTGAETVEEVQHHPCNEVHTAEVIGLSDYPAKGDTPYPGESMLFAFADDFCLRTFGEYTGRDARTDPELAWGYFYPIDEGWREGDHEVACYLLRDDEGPMKQSFRREA